MISADTSMSGRCLLHIDEPNRTASTWEGLPVGQVSFGRAYHDSLGAYRVSVTVYAFDGSTYHGTFYKGYGDYARVRVCKNECLPRVDAKIQYLYSCSDAEIKQRWSSYSTQLKSHLEHYFPELFKTCLEAIERQTAREGQPQ